jgi:hypothetical protein
VEVAYDVSLHLDIRLSLELANERQVADKVSKKNALLSEADCWLYPIDS